VAVTVGKPPADYLGTAWADQLARVRQDVVFGYDVEAAEEQVLMHLAAAADGYRGAYPMPATSEEDDGWVEARIAEDAAPQDVIGAEAFYRLSAAEHGDQDDDSDGWF
jgi:hypothetical protein